MASTPEEIDQCSAPAVGTGRPRPPLSKKSIDFDHEIMENESSDSDHEKNVGTPAILGRALIDLPRKTMSEQMIR
jgi:hypothetical protein